MILLFLIQSVIGGPYGDDRFVHISVEFSGGCLWRTLESSLLFVNYFNSKEYLSKMFSKESSRDEHSSYFYL